MKANDDLVPVSQFIAESERNIEIATAIYEHYEDARAQIVSGFLKRLSSTLKAKLPGWSTSYDVPFFTKRYGAFDLFKPAWTERYTVRIEAYDYGKGMVYGVWRDAPSLTGVPPSGKLLAAVKAVLPRATSRSYYEAEILMSSPATDWRTPGALWRMHCDTAFHAEVEALLLEIVGLVEAPIDEMVKQRQRKRSR